MAVIQVDINDKALEILEESAARKDISVSEFIRRAVLSKLEDEEDLRAAQEAYEDYLRDGKTYTSEEVWREIGA